ncbi:MAG TPA: MFS transporter [Oligoflexia bacterium]|nr:MFS transporter [Oligoflexia bacterium]HMP47508.1 MFS transporter [Oligoflexia bacterium]
MIDKKVKFAILVSALGYFVDAFDMLLFSILRVSSLTELGLSGDELLLSGKFLINCQMSGLLIGGLIWGILGDKIGRVQVLFGSIFLYSSATFLNGFISDTTQYAILRFIAGFGLAGELGGAVTLVTELMPKEKRGIGTTIIATIGVAGVVAASLVGKIFSWRTTFIIGGIMGFFLLFLRVKVSESGIYKNIKQAKEVKKGSLILLFGTFERSLRYLSCILIATPTWFLVGVIMTFSKEIGESMGLLEKLEPGTAIMWCYVGLTLGDLCCGVFSQILKSRKKAIFYFLVGECLFLTLLFTMPIKYAWHFYALSVPLGFFVGYWVIFITTSAEQFGTNIRATVSTSVPNFVRASAIPMVSSFVYFKTTGFAITTSAIIVGVVTLIFSFLGLIKLKESFYTDLDYLE